MNKLQESTFSICGRLFQLDETTRNYKGGLLEKSAFAFNGTVLKLKSKSYFFHFIGKFYTKLSENKY